MESILSVIVSAWLLVELVGNERETRPRARIVFVHFPVMLLGFCRVEKYVPSLLCTPFTAANVIRTSVDGPRQLPARREWPASTDLDGEVDLAEYYDVMGFFLLAFKRIVAISCSGVLVALPSFLRLGNLTRRDGGFDTPPRLDALGVVVFCAVSASCTGVACCVDKYLVRPRHAKLVERCLTQPRCPLLHSSLLGGSLVYAVLLFFPTVPHLLLRLRLAGVHTARVLSVLVAVRGARQRVEVNRHSAFV